MAVLRRLVLIALIALLAAPLASCGRRGALEAPEGSTYPKAYPADTHGLKSSDKNK